MWQQQRVFDTAAAAAAKGSKFNEILALNMNTERSGAVRIPE